MKYILYILLFSASACSPDNDDVLLEKESSLPAPPEPVTSKPGASKPGTSIPGTSEPGSSDSVPSYSVVSDSVVSDSVASDSVVSYSVVSYSVVSDSVTPEPGSTEPVTSEPVPSEPVPSEPASSEPASSEPASSEPVPPVNRNTANLIYTETFENPNLDLNPDLSDFYLEEAATNSFKLDENIKRAGATAGRFEINKSDPEIWGGNRTEMSQAQSTTQEEGWYGFSQYFPDSYISDSTGEVIGQWHDKEDVGETASRSPSNTLLTADNRIKWMARWDADKIMDSGFTDGLVYIDLGPIPKNKWIDWVIHIKFSHTNTGIVEVWKDGVKVIDRINMPNAYNDDNYPYFKFGVYKWEWGTSASQRNIYYDEVRIGNSNSSYDEVKPSGSPSI